VAQFGLKRPEGQQGERLLFPEGKYRVKVMGTKEASGESKKDGKKPYAWHGAFVSLKFIGGEHDQHVQDFLLFDGSDGLISLFNSAGYEFGPDDEQADVNLDDTIGLDLNVFLEVNKKTNFNTVVRFELAPTSRGKTKTTPPVSTTEEA